MGEGSGIPSLPYPSIAQLPIRLKGNSNINALLRLGGGGGGRFGGRQNKDLDFVFRLTVWLQKGQRVLLMVFHKMSPMTSSLNAPSEHTPIPTPHYETILGPTPDIPLGGGGAPYNDL